MYKISKEEEPLNRFVNFDAIGANKLTTGVTTQRANAAKFNPNEDVADYCFK